MEYKKVMLNNEIYFYVTAEQCKQTEYKLFK